MPSDEHGDQVVAHLLVVALLALHVHQEAEQRRILNILVVTRLEGLDVLLRARLERGVDRGGELVVKQGHVLLEEALARHNVGGARYLPVRPRGHGAVLRLPQRLNGRLDHGRGVLNGLELVVEHGPPDNVERERAEPLLEVADPARRGAAARALARRRDARLRFALHGGVEVDHQLLCLVAEHVHHGREPSLVERWHDRAPPHLPGLRVCRDEALAHHILQNLGQRTLIVPGRVVAQHVLGGLGLRDDNERFGPEAELVHIAELLHVLEQAKEHGTVR
mmetsp:Transcript_29905/g.79914  ORF Transcript_29905/g.79914 Transcript_29905/m.79914 type:complete len:279 (-) Transcript_29905:493-1329(-)